MQELIKNSKDKLSNEINENEKNPYIKVIGDYVITLVPNLNQQTLEAITNGEKTIKGSIEAMKKEARKVAVNGMGMLTDEEGYKIVREYFGMNGAARIIDLNAFL